MVNVPKHCWNLHHSIFIRFIDHCQVNWVGKRLSYRHAESLACLQKHCMSMKSILFLIETIERYQLRCNYFENKNIFLYFLLHFRNRDEVLNILRKKVTLTDFVFPKLQTPKTWSDKCLKNPLSDNPWTSNMANVRQHCSNLHHSIFIIFIDHCKVNWLGKSLCFWRAKSCDCCLIYCLPMKSILFLIETI